MQSQILEQTGRRFLMHGMDDAATLRALMDNAAEQGLELNLHIGLSLSAEQIAALTKDIVWLEERVVNGEKALVP